MSGVVGVPPLQIQSYSTSQELEHPSPSIEFPSSQSYKPKFFPSPQTSTHEPDDPITIPVASHVKHWLLYRYFPRSQDVQSVLVPPEQV